MVFIIHLDNSKILGGLRDISDKGLQAKKAWAPWFEKLLYLSSYSNELEEIFFGC